MIESVSTVLSSPQLLRGGNEQVVPAETARGEVREVAEAPRAPFVSPFISIDVNFDTAVLQIRDSDTGDVVRQFPSEARLRAQSLVDSSEGLVDVAEAVQSNARSSSDPTAASNGAATLSAAQPAVIDVSASPSGGGAPLAQIASAALASGAQSGLSSLSAGVSVLV